MRTSFMWLILIFFGILSPTLFIHFYSALKVNHAVTSRNMPGLKESSFDFGPITIGVVLQVFKRNSLKLQLDSIVNQTLLPTTVIVLQNGYHVDVSKVITDFCKPYHKIEIQHIASSKNLRFHGRFYIAYMMQETYVSVWDDDIIAKSQWLEFCVDFSKRHGNALVAANGRTFIEIYNDKVSKGEELIGRNYLGGHIWMLPREFLKYYLKMKCQHITQGKTF